MSRSDRESLFRPEGLEGIEEAEAILGVPVRRNARLVPSRTRGRGIYTYGLNRLAEIVMVLPRPGGLLFHTKEFYPSGVYRLPTGGVKDGEPIIEAARREIREETGLDLKPTRFLFHLRYPGKPGSPSRGFHSIGLLYPKSDRPIAPVDSTEEISGFRVYGWPRVLEVIESLETIESGWLGWGQFRALSHSLLLECRGANPEWFESAE